MPEKDNLAQVDDSWKTYQTVDHDVGQLTFCTQNWSLLQQTETKGIKSEIYRKSTSYLINCD